MESSSWKSHRNQPCDPVCVKLVKKVKHIIIISALSKGKPSSSYSLLHHELSEFILRSKWHHRDCTNKTDWQSPLFCLTSHTRSAFRNIHLTCPQDDARHPERASGAAGRERTDYHLKIKWVRPVGGWWETEPTVNGGGVSVLCHGDKLVWELRGSMETWQQNWAALKSAFKTKHVTVSVVSWPD